MKRVKAKLIYLAISLFFGYFIFSIIFDKPVATGNKVNAVVKKIVPFNYFTHSRTSGSTKRTKFFVHFLGENEVEVIRTYSSSSKYNVGQKVKLREYKSKYRGKISYRVTYY